MFLREGILIIHGVDYQQLVEQVNEGMSVPQFGIARPDPQGSLMPSPAAAFPADVFG